MNMDNLNHEEKIYFSLRNSMSGSNHLDSSFLHYCLPSISKSCGLYLQTLIKNLSIFFILILLRLHHPLAPLSQNAYDQHSRRLSICTHNTLTICAPHEARELSKNINHRVLLFCLQSSTIFASPLE